MTEGLWWQHGVVYQIYPRSYRDASGDGIGDLTGITEKIDYVASLGVDAIWLSPFYRSPMADFGYDVADYRDVDPMFGTLQDFDTLLHTAHDRNLKVIIDFVPNHTSDRHPWFLESRSSRDNTKRDWYVWRDPAPDGGPPNNWIAHFGGPAWEWDEGTGQYYLHMFLKEQPDLNWRNPAVREAMFDVVRYWLDRGVDGFRIDVAHLIMKDPDLRDNPPNPDYRPGTDREYAALQHLHDGGHPDVHGVYMDLRRVLDSYSEPDPRMMVGEIHIYDWPQWATYYGPHLDEFHLPFNFGLVKAPWTVEAVRGVVHGVEAATRSVGAWPNYVLGNHDEHRIASRAGREQAGVAMMLLLTLRGTPTMYYGDEIGMTDVDVPWEMRQDPSGKAERNQATNRDPERTPMQWNGEPNAGFCPPDVAPWLPIADDYRTVNVAAEESEPQSMLSLTRALLRLRRESPALEMGTYSPTDGTTPDLFVYTRARGDERYLIALNFSGEDRRLSVDGMGEGEIVLSTCLDRTGRESVNSMPIRPHEGVIIRLQ